MSSPTSPTQTKTTMKALVSNGQSFFELLNVPLPPPPKPSEILIKVIAAAINPTDWKTLLINKTDGVHLGCDFSGYVQAIGKDVPHDIRHIGERVAGAVHGGIGTTGSFSEYILIPYDLVFTIPDSITFETAAQLPIALWTACLALNHTLNLPLSPQSDQVQEKEKKEKEKEKILIWGGTSSTGFWTIQLANLHFGLEILTTVSPSSLRLLQSLPLPTEEIHTWDYADSLTPRRIVTFCGGGQGGGLRMAVDCISEGTTPNMVVNSLCSGSGGGEEKKGKVASLLPYPDHHHHKKRTNNQGLQVEIETTVVYLLHGKELTHPWPLPSSPHHRTLGTTYNAFLSHFLAQNVHRLSFLPIKVLERGLWSVNEGMEMMKGGKVHGEKVVVRIGDTFGVGGVGQNGGGGINGDVKVTK